MQPTSTTSTPARFAWGHWIEPWYLPYALLGAVVAGMIPILLPLLVNQAGSAAQVGLVMGMVSLGGLAAPVWGHLADRYRLHRWLLTGGLFLTTVGLAAFLFAGQPILWLILALIQSIGAAGAATVANLFVVEVHPKEEWDERIGWLQTFYGGGQVVGLMVAGIFSQEYLRLGLWIAAGLTVLAGLLAWLTTHTPPPPAEGKPVLLHPPHSGEWAISSPSRLFHHISLKSLGRLGVSLRSTFGVFLTGWVLTFGGAAVVFSFYPVMMQKVFGLAPSISSAAFALAAGLGLALYTPAGHWSERWGAPRVLRSGLALRLLAFAGLFGLQFLHSSVAGWLAAVAFILVVLAWSLLSVSGTLLVAQLSPAGEGEGLGVFNAASALAGMIGAALGGWVAGVWGYPAALLLSVGSTILGLALFSIKSI